MKVTLGTALSAMAALGALAVIAGFSLLSSPATEAHSKPTDSGDHYAVLHAVVKTGAIANSEPLPADFDAERWPGAHNARLARIQQDITDDIAALADPDNEICQASGRPVKTNGVKNVQHLYCDFENVQSSRKNIFERTQAGCCYAHRSMSSNASTGARLGYVSGNVDGDHMIVVVQMDCKGRKIHDKWPLAPDYAEYDAADFIDRTLEATRGRPKGYELLDSACTAAGF